MFQVFEVYVFAGAALVSEKPKTKTLKQAIKYCDAKRINHAVIVDVSDKRNQKYYQTCSCIGRDEILKDDWNNLPSKFRDWYIENYLCKEEK